MIRAGVGVNVFGAGTVSSPYVVESEYADVFALRVDDSGTVDLSLTGGGTPEDPYVLRADAGGSTKLADLADVDDIPVHGEVPTWIGDATNGSFHFTPQGTWYCTSTTKPSQPFQGLEIYETDTGIWREFNGNDWIQKAGGTSAGIPTSWPTGKLAGIVQEVNLPTRLREAPRTLTTEDLNSIIQTGWYRGNGIAHAPGVTGWYWFEVIGHDPNYVVQIAHAYSATSKSYRRTKNNGTWSAWDEQISLRDAVSQLKTKFAALGADGNIDREAVPFKMAAGHIVFGDMKSVNGGWGQTAHVNFPAGRFKSPPEVTTGIHSEANSPQKAGVVNVTKDGFDLHYWRDNFQDNVWVSWMALDEGAGS